MKKTVWYNACVLTVDSTLPRAEALVTEGNRILFVGSSREALARGGAEAEPVDLSGRCVTPGFNDNHVHSVILGDQVDQPDLASLSAEEIVALLKERYPAPRRGEVIIGYDWDYPACPDPRKELLDQAFPDNPVILAQFGGHGMWLNSRALARLKISRDRPGPKTGVVLRDPTGEPTGVVREMGNNAILSRHFMRLFFRRSIREPRIRKALEIYRRFGITSVQDNIWFFPVLASLTRLRRRGELSARYSCWSYGELPWTVPLMRLASYDEHWVRRGPRKHFLDGSFSTRTAWLWEAYADDPANSGSGSPPERILPILRSLARRGTQGAFHAIGDRAVSSFLDAVERLRVEHPESRALRFRLEHAQLIRPQDVPRLREYGVLVAAQPSALTTPEKDIGLLGEERAQAAYPYRSLLDGGVHLSFGSDVPGEPTCDPILSIHMVANRKGPQRITPEEALRCYTLESAYAEFQEEHKGSLTPGKLADFVVLSQDITAVPPERIRETKVEMTIVDGRVIYDRTEEEAPTASGDARVQLPPV